MFLSQLKTAAVLSLTLALAGAGVGMTAYPQGGKAPPAEGRHAAGPARLRAPAAGPKPRPRGASRKSGENAR